MIRADDMKRTGSEKRVEQELIAYLYNEHKGGNWFVRCKNRGCQKSEHKGYVDVTDIMKPKVKLNICITLPCCQSKAKIKSVEFLHKNMKTPSFALKPQ